MFIKAKKKREELLLPIQHYIVADDWLDKLGDRAFTSWLRFITWCDRKDDNRENDKIPYSIEKVAERLGVTKPTLYNKVIIPLWEYGFIDLIEYEDSTRKTQKPMNIIVYPFPQNNKDLETRPLEKCRDWKKDYNSQAQIFANRRGKKKEKIVEKPVKTYKLNRKNNFMVQGKNFFTVHRKNNFTVTVKKFLPINETNNSFFNVLNNSLINDSNTLLMDEEGTLFQDSKLYNLLIDFKVDPLVSKNIVELANENKILFYDYEVKEQLKQMYFERELEGKKIINFPFYFLNGIVMQRQQRKGEKLNQDLTLIQREKAKKQRTNLGTSSMSDLNTLELAKTDWLEN